MKSLVHLIIIGVMVLAISYAIASISTKTIHIHYKYEDEKELLLMLDRGWELKERSAVTRIAHLTKVSGPGKIRWIYPARKNIENY